VLSQVRSPALHIGPLVCLFAACGNSGPPAGTTETASSPPHATATSAAPSVTASATAPTTASAPAPLPSTDPATVHTTAPTASAALRAEPDAGAKKPPKVAATARPDAGSADAGAVASADAGAAAASPGLAIARQVDAIFAAKKTFSATFKQQYTLKVTGVVKDSSGVVFIERPSKISFRYDPPNQNRIVSDGVTIKVYIADDKQMIETPAQQTAYPGALAFMMGNGISRSFDFAINTRAKWSGGVVLDGKPLTPNPSYDLAMFYIDQTLLEKADPNAMKRVLVVDAQGNKNRFDFENVTQPASINPAEFTFTPPPGTDVKRQGP